MMLRLPKIMLLTAFAFLCFEGQAPTTPVKTSDETTLRVMPNKAFKRGEILKYRVHYGWIDAGEAIIQVTDENKQIDRKSPRLNSVTVRYADRGDLHSFPPGRSSDLAFKRGHILKYRVHQGWRDAGEAIIQVKDENKQ